MKVLILFGELIVFFIPASNGSFKILLWTIKQQDVELVRLEPDMPVSQQISPVSDVVYICHHRYNGWMCSTTTWGILTNHVSNSWFSWRVSRNAQQKRGEYSAEYRMTENRVSPGQGEVRPLAMLAFSRRISSCREMEWVSSPIAKMSDNKGLEWHLQTTRHCALLPHLKNLIMMYDSLQYIGCFLVVFSTCLTIEVWKKKTVCTHKERKLSKNKKCRAFFCVLSFWKGNWRDFLWKAKLLL